MPGSTANRPTYCCGLRLGRPSTFTAFAVLERRNVAEGTWTADCRALRRWPPGTGYPEIADDLAEMVSRQPLPGCRLAVDRTAIGAEIVKLLRDRQMPCSLSPVLVTSGHAVTSGSDGWHVPRGELAGTLQALLQTGRLQIASTLPDAGLLRDEMLAFTTRAATDGATAEDWRERSHDDLVVAVGLAAWLAVRGVAEPVVGVEVPRRTLADRFAERNTSGSRRGLYGRDC